MKVVITNTVVLNGGDAAILTAVMRHVQTIFGKDVRIVVADTRPDVARRYYHEFEFTAPLYVRAFPPRRVVRWQKVHGLGRFARWYSSLPRLYSAAFALGHGQTQLAKLLSTQEEWETLRHYAEADLIISTGGTYLVENYWLALHVFEFRIALLLGKPLVLYTQSMGPFESSYARRSLKSIFRNAALVLLRDEESLQNLHDLCDPSEVNARLAADAVFSLADPKRLEASAAAHLPKEGMKVAVSVRRWPFFQTMSEQEGMEAFKSSVAHTVEGLVRERGADVEFLSTCQGVPDYNYDDSAVAAEIVERLPDDVKPKVQVNAGFHRPRELMEKVAGYDLVIATRMHMAILALAAGVPVAPISYEFKTKALFDQLGLGKYVCDIEQVSGGRLQETVHRFIERVDGLRSDLFSKVEEQRRRADAAADCLEFVGRIRADFSTAETDEDEALLSS